MARFELAGRSLTASFLLHFSVIILLLYLPQALPATAARLDPASSGREKIYYRVRLLDSTKMLPRIAPAGPGARPGNGFLPDRLPALGSTASHGSLTVVSKPLRPDNFRQTILQSSSPPDLRITTELKLPNIVIGTPLEAPKAPLAADSAKPIRTNRSAESAASPDLGTPATPTTSLVSLADATNPQPRLPMPSPAAPIAKRRDGSSEAGDPGDAVSGTPGDSRGLLVIGVDSSELASQVVLPPGNRAGEFSISPAGGQPGSPGGSPNGVIGGGTGGSGPGGDGSTGIGPGGGGGGGGTSGPRGDLSVSGGGDNAEVSGNLGPGLPLSMVYPVPASFRPRRNALVIAAGPMGGGGLDAYGALHCGKIYTIFLPMPGKSWTLQYCEKASPSEKAVTDSRAPVVHLHQGLVPPDVESRFDFKRLPVPEVKAHKMIVLRGILQEDGTVSNLQVYQGVLPEMDEAARIAFGRWKFRPAMRDGRPVLVEILLGIPPEAPTARETQ